MVKTTKSGRVMNPADAHRKEERKREIARNKLERKFTREAVSNRSKPEEIKKQLQELIEVEDAGKLSKAQKLHKKVLQDAYEQALLKKKEEDNKKRAPDGLVGGPRPEDSRYYHPTLNPTGAPPPGKMAAGLVSAPTPGNAAAAAAADKLGSIPLPKPPPLPAGPAPKLPAPPSAPPLPAGPAPSTVHVVLPPPPGPPPGFPGAMQPAPLPPPSVPPPGWRLPPPLMPPPGMLRFAPPAMPPPHFLPQQQSAPAESMDEAPGMEGVQHPGHAPLPPPSMPPPMYMMPPSQPQHMPQGMAQAPLPPPSMPPPATQHASSAAAIHKAGVTTITGSSTVVKRPLAQNDRSLTNMVPASVRVRREEPKQVRPSGMPLPVPRAPGAAYGLAPIPRSVTSAPDPDAPAGVLAPMQPVTVTVVAGATNGGVVLAGAGAAQAGPVPVVPITADAKYQEFMATMRELGAV